MSPAVIQSDRHFQGVFRPLFNRLWTFHAVSEGIDPKDKNEREFWYRDFLVDSIGVATTKGITETQQRILIDRATAMLPQERPVQTREFVREPDPGDPFFSGFTPGQNKVALALARKAHAREVARRSTNKSLDAWSTSEIDTCLPHSDREERTTLALMRNKDKQLAYEAVMLQFAVIANDTFWIKRLAGADETRLRWQMKRYLVDLSWLYGKEMSWDYVRGIWKQSTLLPKDLEDAPLEQLRQCLAMLDTHIRRVCEKRGLRPMELPTRAPETPHQVRVIDGSARVDEAAGDEEVPF